MQQTTARWLFDEIWAPSRYAAEAISQSAPVPVTVIPHCITSRRNSLLRSVLLLPEDKFIFLFIYDEHSNYQRKNPQALIRAFNIAFGRENDSVQLPVFYEPKIKSDEENSMENNPKILILTPVKDAAEVLDSYFANLLRLQFPPQHLSLGFLESDSRDETYSLLQQKLPELRRTYRNVGLWKKDFGFQIPQDTPRWSGNLQYQRRAILARSRNHLLFRALDDEDWVLWLDADVCEYPADIIQRLLATGKEIVHPNCVLEYGGKSYDRNAWRDKKKYHLDDLRREGDLVKLHAVGGTMLLIKADLHRDGLIFPPFLYGKKNRLIRRFNFFFANRKEALAGLATIPAKIFRNRYQGEMETEGLGIMANDMGHECWGMPNLEIRHRS